MSAFPFIEDGIGRLRTRWPQAHAELGPHGGSLIVIPGVLLPKGYRETICTLLFEAPTGFPGAVPQHFFTDIDIQLDDGEWPKYTTRWSSVGVPFFPSRLWPQWAQAMGWKWRLQRWNPNRDSLYTYAQVCRQRLACVE